MRLGEGSDHRSVNFIGAKAASLRLIRLLIVLTDNRRLGVCLVRTSVSYSVGRGRLGTGFAATSFGYRLMPLAGAVARSMCRSWPNSGRLGPGSGKPRPRWKAYTAAGVALLRPYVPIKLPCHEVFVASRLARRIICPAIMLWLLQAAAISCPLNFVISGGAAN